MKSIMYFAAVSVLGLGILGCLSSDCRMENPIDTRMSIATAVEKLITDPVFSEKYTKALSRAKKKGLPCPVLTIMRIENNVDGKSNINTTIMYRRLQVAIRKTGMFDLVDPEKRESMASIVIKEADMGVRLNNSGIQTYGEYDPSDFIMTAELTQEEDNALALYVDMTSTHDGKMFWNEIVNPSDSFTR